MFLYLYEKKCILYGVESFEGLFLVISQHLWIDIINIKILIITEKLELILLWSKKLQLFLLLLLWRSFYSFTIHDINPNKFYIVNMKFFVLEHVVLSDREALKF